MTSFFSFESVLLRPTNPFSKQEILFRVDICCITQTISPFRDYITSITSEITFWPFLDLCETLLTPVRQTNLMATKDLCHSCMKDVWTSETRTWYDVWPFFSFAAVAVGRVCIGRCRTSMEHPAPEEIMQIEPCFDENPNLRWYLGRNEESDRSKNKTCTGYSPKKVFSLSNNQPRNGFSWEMQTLLELERFSKLR